MTRETAWLGTLTTEFPTIKVRLGGEPEIRIPTIPPLRVKGWGVHAGESYVDVGILHGYREAIQLLERRPSEVPLSFAR